MFLRPIVAYRSLFSMTRAHVKKLKVLQNRMLKIITGAQWFVQNDKIRKDLGAHPLTQYSAYLARDTLEVSVSENPVIKHLQEPNRPPPGRQWGAWWRSSKKSATEFGPALSWVFMGSDIDGGPIRSVFNAARIGAVFKSKSRGLRGVYSSPGNETVDHRDESPVCAIRHRSCTVYACAPRPTLTFAFT